MNASYRYRLLIAALGFVFVTCAACLAQTVNIWPGVAPGSEHWTQKEQFFQAPYGKVIIDVVTPTLTLYLPEKAHATGTGVIVAPGGACVALAYDYEGTQAAEWLAARGIAAFLLKYRLQEKKGEGLPTDINFDEACRYGIADGGQALKVVRAHATEWGIAREKVGLLGFSAGGMVMSEVLLQDDETARPNFVGLIYGAPFGAMPKIPSKLPPIFMAWAQDDDLVREPIEKFYAALLAAGIHPEAHIYSGGGHGFGMKKHGTTSDHWIEEFYWWMKSRGFGNRE